MRNLTLFLLLVSSVGYPTTVYKNRWHDDSYFLSGTTLDPEGSTNTAALTVEGGLKADQIQTGHIYLTNSNAIWFYERSDNGHNRITLQAPVSLGVDTNFILPTADGTTGQSLKTDGSGNLGWVTNQASATSVSAGAAMKIIRGSVNPDGTAAFGEGFTSAKGSTGVYTVTFTAVFASVPACTFTQGDTGNDSTDIQTFQIKTTAVGSVLMRTEVDGGALSDTRFHFICVGPR